MKLSRKIAIVMLGISLMLSLSIVTFSFFNARSFVIKQLRNNVWETASNLGDVLNAPLILSDKNRLSTMLQTRVDKGDASQIVIRNAQGKTFLSVKSKKEANDISGFFNHLAAIPSIKQSTSILYEGKKQGSLEVTANDVGIIQLLLSHTLYMLICCLISIIISTVLVLILVNKLLKPLQKVTVQAKNLLNDEYPIINTLDYTFEFRELTLSLNEVARRMRCLVREKAQEIELLRQQTFKDPLTGFINRRSFLYQISVLLHDADGFVPSYLFFIAIDGLQELNEREGYVQGDKMILQIPPILSKFAKKYSISCTARIGGSQFGFIIQAKPDAELKQCISKLQQRIEKKLQKTTDCKVFIGGAPCRFMQPKESLFPEVDKALKRARDSDKKIHIDYDSQIARSEKELNELFSNGKFALYWQKVTNKQRVLHRKVFAKLISKQGEVLSALSLLPAAEQAGLAWKIDSKILEGFRNIDPDNLEPFALSLFSNTITHTPNWEKYLNQLSNMESAMRRLIHVELLESQVWEYPEHTTRCILALRKIGVRTGIAQIGTHFESLDYLENFTISYVKLHSGLITDIVGNESKNVLVQNITKMAKKLDIEVIASQVEEESQWSALKAAGVIWGQGKILGGLEPIPGINLPAEPQF